MHRFRYLCTNSGRPESSPSRLGELPKQLDTQSRYPWHRVIQTAQAECRLQRCPLTLRGTQFMTPAITSERPQSRVRQTRISQSNHVTQSYSELLKSVRA